MVASNLVLIPGAAGVGRAVFEQLRAREVPVRFMVRRADERAAELKGLGAEVVIGDLTRPETLAGTHVHRPNFGKRFNKPKSVAAIKLILKFIPRYRSLA